MGRPLLRRLAGDHDRALRAIERLRSVVEKAAPAGAAVERFLALWDADVAPHYRMEEEVLLPELSRSVPEGDALIVLTLADHVRLRRLARAVRSSTPDGLPAVVGELLEKAREHARFEEGVLFPALEELLGRARLARLRTEYARMVGRGSRSAGERRG